MEETSVLIEKSQAGDKAAREVLIESNLGLVHTIVRRFLGRGYEAEDLFQIGCIGLMKAIDKFNLSLGLKFSTYAVPLIAGEIKRFLRDDGPVKVSRTIKENAMKAGRARQHLQIILKREPTLQEIAQETQLSREDIVMAMEASSEVESLYSSISKEDGSAMYLVDRVALCEQGAMGNGVGAGGFCQDFEKEKLLNHMLLQQLMDSLAEGERRLIYMRYFENKTQVEIAATLGISQVQVSRLEKKILRRLRDQIH